MRSGYVSYFIKYQLYLICHRTVFLDHLHNLFEDEILKLPLVNNNVNITMINVVLWLIKVFQMPYSRLKIEAEGAHACGIVIQEK